MAGKNLRYQLATSDEHLERRNLLMITQTDLTDDHPEQVISDTQSDALQKFARTCESMVTARNGMRRAVAVDAMAQVRAALTIPQWAILDMVHLKGRTIAQVAELTGQPAERLTAVYLSAADALASHYGAQED